MEDSEFARHLWQASSLDTIFADICLGPRRAVGLNANIRLYRQCSHAWHAVLYYGACYWRCLHTWPAPGHLHNILYPAPLLVSRYVPGQKFGQHYDDAVQTAGGTTAYTLLIYFGSGALVGGSTVFYGACTLISVSVCAVMAHRCMSNLPCQLAADTILVLRHAGKKGRSVALVEPRVGLALLHRHGDDCLLHESLLVKSGTKYVLRSDVVFTDAPG